jgi:ATP-binding cassette subfamily B protein
MDWLENTPPPIRESLKTLNLDGDLELALATDVGRDGRFGERWLVATKERLLVFSPDGKAAVQPDHDLTFERIESVASDNLVGLAALEAKVDGDTVELLRYSNTLTKKFSKAAKRLDQRAKGEEIKPDEEEEKPRFCPQCGMLFPDWSTVCPACLNKLKVVQRLFRDYVRPYLFWVLLLGALMVSATALSLVPPQLMRKMIDGILVPRAHEKTYLLGWIVLGLLGVHLGESLMSMCQGRMTAWLGSKLTHDVRTELYRTVEWQSLRFFDKHQVGEVMSRVTNDTRSLQGFLVEGGPWFVINILQLLGIGAALFWMDWKLALWILLPVPLIIAGTYWFWRRVFRLWRRQWRFWSKLSDVLNDALTGIKVVKAFAGEEREISRFEQGSEQLYMTSMRAEQMWATFYPLLGIVTQAGTLMVWLIGGRHVLADGLSLGTLTAFLWYLAMFYGPIRSLSHISDWLSHALTAAERIFEVLDAKPEILDQPDAVPLPHIEGKLELRDVTFGYEKHNPVLHNIDLTVEPGEMIGFVGQSGAGKSTMINLISRFYDVDEGQLLIDGVDVRKIKYDDLRRQLGVVLQDTFLFAGTVADNIAYSKPDATLEEIMDAAKAANAHDFIVGFPDGYDTSVGERGQRLSGGERQRIAIARAILSDPRILILDEATSSVDTETERQIQEALARLVKGRTTFAIAHRLSTLRNANRLLVLDKGKKAELGTHDELMEAKGAYHKLVEMQTEMGRIQAVGG